MAGQRGLLANGLAWIARRGRLGHGSSRRQEAAVRGGRWEGRDIKVRGSPNCHQVGGTCLPIENWQIKTGTAIEQALEQFENQNGDRRNRFASVVRSLRVDPDPSS